MYIVNIEVEYILNLLHVKYSICSLVSKRCWMQVGYGKFQGFFVIYPKIYHNQSNLDLLYKIKYIWNT